MKGGEGGEGGGEEGEGEEGEGEDNGGRCAVQPPDTPLTYN